MITTIIMPCSGREKNLPEIIKGIRSQSVSSQLWIIDNYGHIKPNANGEDLLIYFSKDQGHRPRFPLCNLVTTEYIYIQVLC